MLFNSHLFIFIFLPLSLFLFHLLNSYKLHDLKIKTLVFSSLFFYGWWNPKYLFLLIFSVLINYFFGKILLSASKNKFKLAVGISINLLILGYYKYSNFFLENINLIIDRENLFETLILPLGISFFTFQQITYLVDCFSGIVKKHNIIKYFLFVTFFPQIVAGPIVHHSFMMPQFDKLNEKIFENNKFNVGVTTFTIGLFKKLCLADNLAKLANPFFNFSELGTTLNFFDAWAGAVIYTFQLYFDFSGYSDMALGIGLMFGIVLPINFFSPFKAKNISEFWMCWHITLSNLIRNYLYYPLSVFFTRKAIQNNFSDINFFIVSIVAPTIIAFFFIGLWHGAGWNFILFGIVNGIYIIIYNIWSVIKNRLNIFQKRNIIYDKFSQVLTFLSFVIALIFFRSSNLENSIHYLKSIFGLGKFDTIDIFQIGTFAAQPYLGVLWILVCFFIIFFLPNTHESVFQYSENNFNKKNMILRRKNLIKLKWKPNLNWAIFTFILFLSSILSLNKESEFLYFQF